MEGVSDNNRGLNDGEGLWFSTYEAAVLNLEDTIGFSFFLDSTEVVPEIECELDSVGDTISCDTLNKDEVWAVDTAGNIIPDKWTLDTSYIETVLVEFGPDTLLLDPYDSLTHIRAVLEVDSMIDSFPPYYSKWWNPAYEFSTISRNITLDLFTQDEFGLPDYSIFGWIYRGWIVTTSVDGDVVTARMTPPPWPYRANGQDFIPGDSGALLSIGEFFRIDSADLSNPFIDPAHPDKVPNYPGEDFLNSVAMQDSLGLSQLRLISPSNNTATVFITLEPMFWQSETNFPLFVMMQAAPDWGTITDDVVSVTMRNWSSALPGDLFGFPRISVQFERL
jgi:hypothetical protein